MAAWEPTDIREFFNQYSFNTRHELATMYGVTFEQVKYFLSQHKSTTTAVESKEAPESLVIQTGINSEGIKTDIRLVNRDIRSLNELMELYKVDPAEWEIIDFECKTGSWDGFWKDADNNAQTKTLYRYSCKARFKPTKKIVRDAFADARALIADARDYMPNYQSIARIQSFKSHEHCLEIDIPDLHMGKRAWNEETGNGNYDVDIAEGLFLDAVKAGLEFGAMFDVGEILFPIGNDLLNCDNSYNTTTKGTPQDVDGRQKKTFRRTRQMLITALEMCLQVAPIKALIIPGNHDRDTAFYLGDTLQGWLHNCTDIEIDNSAIGKKAYRWGENGIMFTHGEEKESDLALTFAEQFPEIWSATAYREVHCGHLHTTRVRDYRGCQVRYIASLTAPDFWHATKNYKSQRNATFFIWQRDGLDAYQKIHNVAPDRIIRLGS